MTSNGVYTGIWHNWEYTYPLGGQITLEGSPSNILIAAIGIWVGNFTAGWVWSVTISIIYSARARRPRDGIRAQHQIVWRNDEDPLTALKHNFRIWLFNLKPSFSSTINTPSSLPPSSNFKRRCELQIRTFFPFLIAFVIWVGFIVAAVLAPQVGNPTGDVLLSADSSRCGLLQYTGSLNDADNVLAQYDSKVLNDTLSARSYAQICYSSDISSLSPSACSFYPVPHLPYNGQTLPGQCPFAPNPGQTFAEGPCAAPPLDYHTGSYLMYTDLLDSSTHLGINAPIHDRILLQKNVTCSPLSLFNRSGPTSGLGTIPNVSYTGYYFGLATGYEPLNFTYFDNSNAEMDNVPFTVTAVYSDSGGNRGVWTPAYPFNITEGDVSLFFFAANSVTYTSVVNDPFFRSSPFSGQAPLGSPKGLSTFYKPFSPVQVMGCVDFYRLCKYPSDSLDCTNSTGRHALLGGIDSLSLNNAQLVTAYRIFDMINNSDTYSSVYGTGTAALKASDTVLGLTSPGLPSDQWRVEVEGWFQTTLAKLQAYAVEYTNYNSTLSPYGSLYFPDGIADTASWEYQCATQRIGNPGGFQTFSLFGLFFIFAFGSAFFVLSHLSFLLDLWRMTPFSKESSTFSDKDLVRRADDMFQMQAMAMQNGGGVQVLPSKHEIPVYAPGTMPVLRADGPRRVATATSSLRPTNNSQSGNPNPAHGSPPTAGANPHENSTSQPPIDHNQETAGSIQPTNGVPETSEPPIQHANDNTQPNMAVELSRHSIPSGSEGANNLTHQLPNPSIQHPSGSDSRVSQASEARSSSPLMDPHTPTLPRS